MRFNFRDNHLRCKVANKYVNVREQVKSEEKNICERKPLKKKSVVILQYVNVSIVISERTKKYLRYMRVHRFIYINYLKRFKTLYYFGIYCRGVFSTMQNIYYEAFL